MRFPVSVKPFRGQLDVAAFAGVLMLLVIFLLLTRLVYTPGARLQLPIATNLPGTDRPTLEVAVDSNGRYYFQNQFIAEKSLKVHLRAAAANTNGPLTLLVQADRKASYEMLIHLTMLAREVGINDAWLAVSPGPFAPMAAPKP